jgi:hypothetical protein
MPLNPQHFGLKVGRYLLGAILYVAQSWRLYYMPVIH